MRAVPSTTRVLDIDSTRILLASGLVAGAIALLWALGDDVAINQKVLASVVILVSTAPFCLHISNRNRSPYMIFELNCSWYAICFGMNGFFDVPQRSLMVSADSGIHALQLSLLAILTQIAAFAAARNWIFRDYRTFNPLGSLQSGQVVVFAWIVTGFATAAILVPALANLPSIGLLTQISSFVGSGTLFALYLMGRLDILSTTLFFLAVIPLETVTRLNTGSVSHVMLYYMMMFVIRLAVRNRISVFLPLVIFGAFILVNPVKMQYRKLVWNPQVSSQMSSIDKTRLIIELMDGYWLAGTQGNERVEENLRGRTDNLYLLRVVQDSTPSYVPYWNGETYESAVYILIPRILWPDKPTINTGNSFGHRYFILHENDLTTALNLPWIIEAYANFGVEGIVVVFTLLGIMFGFLKQSFGHPGINRLNSCLFLCLTIPLTVPESSLVSMWGGLLLSLALFVALAKLLAESQSAVVGD